MDKGGEYINSCGITVGPDESYLMWKTCWFKKTRGEDLTHVFAASVSRLGVTIPDVSTGGGTICGNGMMNI
jgi:hypothetical protein